MTTFLCQLSRAVQKQSPLSIVIAALSITLLCSGAAADDTGKKKKSHPVLTEEQVKSLPEKSSQGDNIPLLSEEAEQTLDNLQQQGSQLLGSTADWIDSFFSDPRYTQEENRTMARLKLGLAYTENDDFESVSSIELRLRLPFLEKKANIFLRANDDSDFEADSNPVSDSPGDQQNDKNDFSAGLQYFLASGEKYNVSTELGVSTGYVYGGLRYRNLHTFISDEWEGRFTNRLRYYTDDGFENKASYDIETGFSERYFFRTTVTGVVAERYDGMPFSAIARLYQVRDIDKAILYDFGTYYETDPELTLTDVQFRFRYRQRFYRDWLVLELAPQITFPEDHDYDPNPGLVIKFEADIGYLQDEQVYHNIFKF